MRIMGCAAVFGSVEREPCPAAADNDSRCLERSQNHLLNGERGGMYT